MGKPPEIDLSCCNGTCRKQTAITFTTLVYTGPIQGNQSERCLLMASKGNNQRKTRGSPKTRQVRSQLVGCKAPGKPTRWVSRSGRLAGFARFALRRPNPGLVRTKAPPDFEQNFVPEGHDPGLLLLLNGKLLGRQRPPKHLRGRMLRPASGEINYSAKNGAYLISRGDSCAILFYAFPIGFQEEVFLKDSDHPERMGKVRLENSLCERLNF